MIRDGSLTGRNKAQDQLYDGFEFSYVTTLTTSTPGAIEATNTNTDTVSVGGVIRMVGAASDNRSCSTGSCHTSPPDETMVAPSPAYLLNDTATSFNVIDYYRTQTPVVLSAVFTASNQITVVFSEPVTAVAGSFTSIIGTPSGARSVSSISGIGTELIVITLSSGVTADEVGTAFASLKSTKPDILIRAALIIS